MVSSNRGRVTRVNYSGQQHSKAPHSNKTVFNLIYIVAICIIFFQIIYGFSGGAGQKSGTVSSSSSSSSTLPKPPSIPTYNTPIVRGEDSPDDEKTVATQDPTEQDSEQETDSDTEEDDDEAGDEDDEAGEEDDEAGEEDDEAGEEDDATEVDEEGESLDATNEASLDLDPTTVTPPADHDIAPDTDD